MSKCIGIVGSRDRTTRADQLLLERKFTELFQEGDSIVSGGCGVGADKWAESLALRRGCTITIHHANWTKHGRKAGPVRNTKIAEQCDVLIALPAADRKGGTDDTVSKCKRARKEVVLL